MLNRIQMEVHVEIRPVDVLTILIDFQVVTPAVMSRPDLGGQGMQGNIQTLKRRRYDYQCVILPSRVENQIVRVLTADGLYESPQVRPNTIFCKSGNVDPPLIPNPQPHELRNDRLQWTLLIQY